MTLRVRIPSPIRSAIGALPLDRAMKVRLLARIHSDIPNDYEKYHGNRVPGMPNAYRHRFAIRGERNNHLFILALDDRKEPGALILVDIRHLSRPHHED